MRTYGRVYNPDGTWTWTKVETDAQGNNDYVWITTLIQCLQLVLGESPFYSNYGIPAEQSVLQQVPPDVYVTATQQRFAGHFASLIIYKVNDPNPHYRVNILTNAGVQVAVSIPK